MESLNISSGISGILYFGISGISGIPYLQSHWHFFHLKTFVFEDSKLYLYLSINISNQRVNIRSNTDQGTPSAARKNEISPRSFLVLFSHLL